MAHHVETFHNQPNSNNHATWHVEEKQLSKICDLHS